MKELGDELVRGTGLLACPLVFEPGLAVIYAIAFTVAGRQFRGLLGSRGLLPIPGYLRGVSCWRKPSLFHLRYSDRLFAAVAWSGAAGFLAVFLGNSRSPPPVLLLWLLRWLLLRLEFGAGLIKLRGDPCWRDLTCLRYHHETQPLPGPLSWFFHQCPTRCTAPRWPATTSRSLPRRSSCSHPAGGQRGRGGHHRYPAVAGGVRQLRLAQLADDPHRMRGGGHRAGRPGAAAACGTAPDTRAALV